MEVMLEYGHLFASNLIYSDDNYFHFFEYDLKTLLILKKR